MMDSEAYYRCYKALHLVTREAIPCVDHNLQQWHVNQNLGPCTTGNCPQGKKPKAPASCKNCVDWGTAVERMLYQPPAPPVGKSPISQTQITWSNVNSSELTKGHVEAAKAFVLRLPKIPPASAQAAASASPATKHQPYTSMEDFDSACLLMIMARFKDFHGGDLACYQIIQKVADMRNKLSHMCLAEDMQIDQPQVKEYFKDLNSLVNCLYNLHPGHFKSAADIKTKLGAIELEPVTDAMKKDMQLLMRQDIQALAKDTKRISATTQQTLTDVQDMSQINKQQHEETKEAIYDVTETTRRMEGKLDDLTKSVEQLGKENKTDTKQDMDSNASAISAIPSNMSVKELKAMAARLQVDVSQCIEKRDLVEAVCKAYMAPPGFPPNFAETFDLLACQEELREFYSEEMGKVNLLPWIPEEASDMESIFVKLEMVGKQTNRSSEEMKKFESNDDLVTLKTSQGGRVNRVLVTGDAGGGKSTMAANIAYKWAKNDPTSPLFKFSLVFLISVHEIQDSKASLVDLIFEQTLPDDSKVSREGLKSFITSNAKDILILVDGMDEDSSDVLLNRSNEITKVLHNRKLRNSCVILTSRSHTVGNLGDHLRHYTQVNLKGFSLQSIELYIKKFFQKSPENVQMLLTQIYKEPHVMGMASIPVLLPMICLLWEDQCTLPKTKTHLYQATVNYLWKRYKSREGQNLPEDDDSDDEEFEEELNVLLHKLGQIALSTCKIIVSCHGDAFSMNNVTERDLGPETFSLGCKLGIISRERIRSKLKNKGHVTFLHKTFIEFCCGLYLADLDRNSPEFQRILDQVCISKEELSIKVAINFVDFCCGINPDMARVFLQQMLKIQDKYTHKNVGDHLRHIFESQLSYEKYLELSPIYSNESSLKFGVDEQNVLYILHLLHLSEMSTAKYGLLPVLKGLSITTDSIIPHLPSLLQHTPNLSEFILTTGMIFSREALENTEFYTVLGTLTTLKRLTMDMSIDTDKALCNKIDATPLFLQLAKNKHIKLEELDLIRYLFDSAVMAKFLQTQHSLSLLCLGSAYNVTRHQPGINKVIKVMPQLKALRTLKLEGFQITGSIKYLRPIISQLYDLVLSNCGLQERHLKELFSFLNRAAQLKILGISHHAFSVQVVLCLVESLKGLPVLEELQLSGADLTDQTACILAKALKEKRTLQSIDLGFNCSIGPKGMDALKGLKEHLSLHTLYLENSLSAFMGLDEGIAEDLIPMPAHGQVFSVLTVRKDKA